MREEKTYYTYNYKREYDEKMSLLKITSKYRYNNYFETPEEATIHFKEAERLANEKYHTIIEKLNRLKSELEFDIIGYAYCSDDTGLEYGAQIEIEVNGYIFTFSQN